MQRLLMHLGENGEILLQQQQCTNTMNCAASRISTTPIGRVKAQETKTFCIVKFKFYKTSLQYALCTIVAMQYIPLLQCNLYNCCNAIQYHCCNAICTIVAMQYNTIVAMQYNTIVAMHYMQPISSLQCTIVAMQYVSSL